MSDIDYNVTKYNREEMEEFINTYTDLVNNTPTKSYSIEFITKDESNNSSSSILSIVVTLDIDSIEEKLQTRIDEWNKKQDEPIVTKPSSGNGNNDGGNNNNDNNDGDIKIQCPNCRNWFSKSDFQSHYYSCVN